MAMNLEDALAVQKTPERLKAMARRGKKVYLGEETRPNWKGYLPFYLFQCPNCRKLVKDYPHSWPESQYLLCPECGQKINFVRFWIGFKEFFSYLLFLVKSRFTRRN